MNYSKFYFINVSDFYPPYLYAHIIKTTLIVGFYSTMVPVGPLLGAVCVILSYWADKVIIKFLNVSMFYWEDAKNLGVLAQI